MVDAAPNTLLTVVVASLDGEATIERALASVCGSAADVDVIVIDDGSTDSTRSIVEAFPDRRVAVVSQANAGRAAARNAGLRLARSEFVMFLDDDDSLSDGAVDQIVAAVRSHPHALVVRFHAEYRSADPELDGRVVRATTSFTDSPTLAGSFAIRRGFLLELDGYDARLDYSENTDLLFRVDDALAGRGGSDRVVVIDRVGLVYHHRPDVGVRYRATRIDAIRILLEVHRARLRRDPKLHASMLGILANDLYRSGRAAEALTPAWTSFRLRPGWRQAARLVRIATARILGFARR